MYQSKRRGTNYCQIPSDIKEPHHKPINILFDICYGIDLDFLFSEEFGTKSHAFKSHISNIKLKSPSVKISLYDN